MSCVDKKRGNDRSVGECACGKNVVYIVSLAADKFQMKCLNPIKICFHREGKCFQCQTLENYILKNLYFQDAWI